MLILSRKENEAIVINDDITIVVVEIRDGKVRLGVEASQEIPVHRREVQDRIGPKRSLGKAFRQPDNSSKQTPRRAIRSN